MKRRLGVNIDHIATLREARRVCYPDPLAALEILKKTKVNHVTIHLREDRRHIQDHDLKRISQAQILPVNLELAVTDEMVKIAARYRPKICTFVPEKRQEVTTEGGLDCLKRKRKLAQAIELLKKKNIHVSLFIDPDEKQIQSAKELGADAIELHTGSYCDELEKFYLKSQTYDFQNQKTKVKKIAVRLQEIKNAAEFADGIGLKVYAGHGLHIHNLAPVVQISEIEEYNIGHAIIARAVFVGLEKAIREIQRVLRYCERHSAT